MGQLAARALGCSWVTRSLRGPGGHSIYGQGCRAWTSSLEIQGKWNSSEQGEEGWAGAAEQRHSKEPPASATSWEEKRVVVEARARWLRRSAAGCRDQLSKHLYLVEAGQEVTSWKVVSHLLEGVWRSPVTQGVLFHLDFQTLSQHLLLPIKGHFPEG